MIRQLIAWKLNLTFVRERCTRFRIFFFCKSISIQQFFFFFLLNGCHIIHSFWLTFFLGFCATNVGWFIVMNCVTLPRKKRRKKNFYYQVVVSTFHISVWYALKILYLLMDVCKQVAGIIIKYYAFKNTLDFTPLICSLLHDNVI